MRPSEAKLWEIPRHFLRVSVRKAEQLPADTVNHSVIERWLADDKPVLLLDLNATRSLPEPVNRYLSTEDGKRARQTYKCQNREPWYAVPDVTIPDGFLTYMNGRTVSLVANAARCVCTNSIHAVRLRANISFPATQRAWEHPVCRLSCELEGHPLGGGMLKLEPGEVARTRLPMLNLSLSRSHEEQIKEGISFMQRWRHYE